MHLVRNISQPCSEDGPSLLIAESEQRATRKSFVSLSTRQCRSFEMLTRILLNVNISEIYYCETNGYDEFAFRSYIIFLFIKGNSKPRIMIKLIARKEERTELMEAKLRASR